MSFRYFRPASLTWWSGIIAIALGVAGAVGWPHSAISAAGASGVWETFLLVTAALLGADATPASLILTGLAIIGLRDKMERDGQSWLFMDGVQVEDDDVMTAKAEPQDDGLRDPWLDR